MWSCSAKGWKDLCKSGGDRVGYDGNVWNDVVADQWRWSRGSRLNGAKNCGCFWQRSSFGDAVDDYDRYWVLVLLPE